ncbi:transposase, IS605 OrfB family [Kyrpidia tusciae DSM 2912]|uniref:Transposase, IS605 OrfB family n=2 Tax=Kyrpidia TaxID=1129704 RepID=D5WSG8_KYRT2|nr:transposase, IS605 OrfB family [Kyrpidia tusciae DSM 2912]
MSLTICGEWFPETGGLPRSEAWARGEETALETEMRLFGSCMRWAFGRLQEGMSREEIKKRGQVLFGLNSRYVDDARLKAQAVWDSQKELLGIEIGETETKLRRARKKLGQAMRKLEKVRVKGDRVATDKLHLTVQGRQARVQKLASKLAELQAHQEAGTIPKVVFGGRGLWRKVCRGKVSKETWRAARRGRLYARGDETKGGNPNIRVRVRGEGFGLAVALSHLAEAKGTDALGRPRTGKAPRVEGKLWLPEKHRGFVRQGVAMGLPYAAEVVRGLDGRYRVKLTWSLAGMVKADLGNGCLAVDINPDGVALCHVGADGGPRPWPDHLVWMPDGLGKYPGEWQATVHPNGFAYVRIPELAYTRGNRREYLIGVLAKVVVDAAKLLGKPLVMEDLAFGKDRLDTNRRFNRMASQFPYAKVSEALLRRAWKERVAIKAVNPRHTSTIGHWKYERRYGVVIHCSAALTIGRRALGCREKITRELRERIHKLKAQKGRSLPKEGQGMTRSVKALLGRLETKMVVHNSSATWQQERPLGIWLDFKRLALALR